MIRAQIVVVNFLLERHTVRVLTGAPASEPPLVAFTEVCGLPSRKHMYTTRELQRSYSDVLAPV